MRPTFSHSPPLKSLRTRYGASALGGQREIDVAILIDVAQKPRSARPASGKPLAGPGKGGPRPNMPGAVVEANPRVAGQHEIEIGVVVEIGKPGGQAAEPFDALTVAKHTVPDVVVDVSHPDGGSHQALFDEDQVEVAVVVEIAGGDT